MRSDLASAILDRIEKYDLNDMEASALFCCETISTKQKKRMFGRKTEVVQTGIILTPLWLIWATGREYQSPGVLAAKLDDIRVQDYEQSDMYKMIQDTGLNIFGLHTRHSRSWQRLHPFGVRAGGAEIRGSAQRSEIRSMNGLRK